MSTTRSPSSDPATPKPSCENERGLFHRSRAILSCYPNVAQPQAQPCRTRATACVSRRCDASAQQLAVIGLDPGSLGCAVRGKKRDRVSSRMQQAIISISGLSKTYASGFKALSNVDLEIRHGEIFALLGPERRRQDHADQHHLRHRQSARGPHPCRRPRHRSRVSRRALPDRPGAPGADHRRLRNGVEHGFVQPRPVRQAIESGAHREGTARTCRCGTRRTARS